MAKHRDDGPKPIAPRLCPHDKGLYKAEEFDIDGKPGGHHERCQGCHIIIRTVTY